MPQSPFDEPNPPAPTDPPPEDHAPTLHSQGRGTVASAAHPDAGEHTVPLDHLSYVVRQLAGRSDVYRKNERND